MCYSEMLERSLRGMHRSEAILCLHVLCELCCFISELLILCELTQTSTYVFKKEWLRIFFFLLMFSLIALFIWSPGRSFVSFILSLD